ncbi:acetyltransferase [Thiohalobacter sp. IOR34]|uniref:acetyltransferase n=1 Tax=Thiohalobacter sp. IOR34 TaxID=3057176 RepID=UPI0025B1265F|nr:acetyltransferase [Thiohalobacter sp. IOR34]WJW74591.1 acetyltransferase [Thiohalobacter sp. IOR34]
MRTPLILLGAGGHARVLAELALGLGLKIRGIAAPTAPGDSGPFAGLAHLGNDEAVFGIPAAEIRLLNGLGSVGPVARRAALYRRFREAGYRFAGLVHPAAVVSPSAVPGEGVLILAGAVVGTEAELDDNVLVNSRALLEHGCHIGPHSHLASGAVVCGDCQIGAEVHVGAGAVINQGRSIGNGAVIASGSVVTRDVEPWTLVAGVPATVIRKLAHE